MSTTFLSYGETATGNGLRNHTDVDAPHSVWLLWTSDQPVA